MIRITGNILKDDTVNNVQRNTRELDKLYNNLATGKKVRIPSEDVSSTVNAMLHRTRLTEMRQFVNNIEEGNGRLAFVDNALQNTTKILQRFEEITVQAANGIYTRDDRAKVAVEIDELLKELVEIGNSKFKGHPMFAGTQTDRDPFVVTKGKPEYADREVITGVIYRGNIGEQKREIEQGEYVPINIPGNKVFWAINQAVISNIDAANYAAPANSQMIIDGKVINIAMGENINAILDKINNANIPVKAELTNKEFGGPQNISLTTTVPHEIWLEDVGKGTILADLGLASKGSPGNLYATTATKYGLSIFDMAIKLRDNLWKDDVVKLGSNDLGNIATAVDNILRYNAEVGAKTHRLETVRERLINDDTATLDLLAKAENVDLEESIMNLRMLEYVHNASLSAGARIIRPTLMDFLR